MNRRFTAGSTLPYVFAALAMVTASILFFEPTLDDAWITFRYGRNLFEGHGLRWNPSDAKPFEAYTSLVHVLLASGCEAAGIDPVLTTKFLGLVLNLALVVLFQKFMVARSAPLSMHILVGAALGTNFLYGFHAVTGMETGIYIFVVTLGTFMFLKTLDTPSRLRTCLLIFLAGILTRPDCGLLFGVYFLTLMAHFRATKTPFFRDALFFLILPGLLYAGFKLAYFGHLLPNSFLFKVTRDELLSFPGGVYVRQFTLGLLPPLALWGYVLWKQRELSLCEFAALLGWGLTMSFYLEVAPKVGVGFRFLVPYFPSLLLLLLPASIRLFDRSPAFRRDFRWLIPVLVVQNALFSWYWLPRVHQYMEPRWINPYLGKLLSGFENREELVLATGEAGALTYFTRMRHLDIYGLVTDLGAHDPFDPGWVFDERIDMFVTHSVDIAPLTGGGFEPNPEKSAYHLALNRSATETLSYKLMAHPAFSEFELCAKISSRKAPGPGDYYYVFVHRSSPVYGEMTQRFASLNTAL